MYIRLLIVQECGPLTLFATQLATRYLSVRRQFSTQNGTKEERKVIDYQTTQDIFARLLARGISMMVASHYATDEFKQMMDCVKKGDFSKMEHNHHILSGFKGIMTDDMYRNVDIARRSTGGAGFASFSGFTNLFRNSSPMPTYEGDNTVMMGQASRYLFKLVTKANKRQKLNFPFGYLNEMQTTLSLKN